MDGLIIKEKWLSLIVQGKKTFEIRGSNTSKLNETIYLLESGTHRVRATCKIEGTYKITAKSWLATLDRHCVDISYSDLIKRYKTPYAWKLSEIVPYEDISYYDHPKGAVIWVKDVSPSDEIGNDEYLRCGY